MRSITKKIMIAAVLSLFSASCLANPIYREILKERNPRMSAKQITTHMQAQRDAFVKAKKLIIDNKSSQARKYRNGILKNYPLNIWLDYYELSRNIESSKFNAAMEFIRSKKQRELGEILRSKYVDHFAGIGDYRKVETLLNTKPFDENSRLNGEQKGLLCRYYEAKWRNGKGTSEAVTFATNLYLDLRSKPRQCTGLLAYFDAKGYLDAKLRMMKFEKAYIQQKYQGTVNALSRELSRTPFAARVKAQMNLYKTPSKLFSLPATKNNRRIATLAFKRLANVSTDQAVRDLKKFEKKFAPSEPEVIDIYQILALNLLGRLRPLRDVQWVDKNLPALAWTDDIKEHRIRRGIWHSQWDIVYRLIDHLPKHSTEEVNWRYFKARAAKELGYRDVATRLYHELAKDRSFYGFLAAQESNLPMAYNHLTAGKDHKFPRDLKGNPAAVRFFELHAIDDRNKIFEWREVAKYSSVDEAFLMAEWALQSQNFNLAIESVISSQRWDALRYRFPIAYRNIYQAEAKRFRVPLSFVYGISRQESMLNARIRSHAGAVGLMQLMPNTARIVARKIKVAYRGAGDLVKPALNVKLGTAFLRQLLDRFSNNRVLVCVGYNAGPNRVGRWKSQDGKRRDVAMYVENIPFNETRLYVQNVILYDAIYNKLLTGREGPLLTKAELNYRY